MVLKLHALRRTAANRIDVAARLSVRTTAACRLFPSGEALPSTTSAGKLPSFVRSLPRYYDLIRLLIRVHTRRTAIAFPSRPGTSPGTGETSQVPHKELHHVRKVSDCARFFPCKPLRHGRCCLLVSELVPRHSDYDMLNRNITATLAGVSDRRGLRCCERRPVAV